MDEGFYLCPLSVFLAKFGCLHNGEGYLGLCEKQQNQPSFLHLKFFLV